MKARSAGVGAAVRRQAHQLDLAFVRVPAEVFRRGAVEPAERMRQSDVPHLPQRAPLAVKIDTVRSSPWPSNTSTAASLSPEQ